MKYIKFFLLVLLSSCAKVNPAQEQPPTYQHDYQEIINQCIEWKKLFLLEKPQYYIYFFSKTCGHCENIKNEVIDIALRYVCNLYFCSGSDIVVDQYILPEGTIGINEITDFKIKGFPSVVTITNGAVSAHIIGERKVLAFVRSLKYVI